MSKPDYTTSALLDPPFNLWGAEQYIKELVQNIVTDTTDPENSNLLINKTGTTQDVHTVHLIKYTDTDDNTNADNNELKPATRRWTKNAFINNVMDPHILATDYNFTASSHIYDTADQLRCKTDGTLLNSVTRKQYVDTALSTKANLNNPTFTGTVSGITKSMVGLSNVDNTTDLNKPISTATQTALDLKANISYVDQQINNVIGSAPDFLNTIQEISAAINDDPSYFSTITTSLAGKASTSYVDTQLATKQNTLTTGSITDNLLSSTFLKSADLNTINSNISTIQTDITTINSALVNKASTTSVTNLETDITNINDELLTINTAISQKQNFIQDGDLTISKVATLSTTLNDLQDQITNYNPTIADGSLTIAKTSGLQTALDSKQATLTTGSITDNLLSSTFLKAADITGKQDTLTTGSIPDNYLQSTFLKAADIVNKQDTITTTTDLIFRNLIISSISEKFISISNNGTANQYNLDYLNGNCYIFTTQPTANFSIRLNNCGSDTTRNIQFTIIYKTTGKYFANSISAYSDTTTAINLTSSTPLFASGTPSLTSSNILIQTFVLIRSFGSNDILSSVISYY